MHALRKFYRTKMVQIFLIAVIFVILFNLVNQYRPATFGTVDLIQYWSAVKIFIANHNPYDSELLMKLQRQELSPFFDGFKERGAQPIRMWNPPLIFPVIFFLSLFSFQVAASFWLILGSGLVVSSFILNTSSHLKADRESCHVWQQYLYLLSFYPLAVSFYYGQLSPVLLFGLSIFLYLAGKRTSLSSNFWAGLALSVTFLKYHLLYLLYIYLVVDAFKNHSFKLLLGILSGLIMMGLPAVLWRPEVFLEYFQAFQASPIYFKTPTLGSWLQELTQIHSLWLRVLPSIIIGAVAFLFFLKRPKESGNFIPLFSLIPLSLLSSPYGWFYDQMLFLPTALWIIATSQEKLRAYLLLGSNTLILLYISLSVRAPGQELFVWYPLVVLLLCYKLKDHKRKSSSL